MFSLPSINECSEFAKLIGCSYIQEILIEPREIDRPLMCHDNCSFNPELGYYFLKDNMQLLHAFKHSVLRINEKLYDVTPVTDGRTYNIFAFGNSINDEHLIYLENSVYIYNHKQREKDMYYVYGLIDPRTNLPFYIGKGKGDRWKFHYLEKSLNEGYNDRKKAKIKKLKSLGYEVPIVEFYAQNIEEDLAYKIETSLILKYGRIGFEENGILTNLSTDSNPPNFKGKSYDFIYGASAEIERKKRAEAQKVRGGYFRGHKHTETSKQKISVSSTHERNGRYSGHTKEELLLLGKEFVEFFDNKISTSKWIWWSKQKGLPTYVTKGFRFKDKTFFEHLSELYGAEVEYATLLWFYCPTTLNNFRCQPWELKYNVKQIPLNYIRGRGTNTFKQKSKITSYQIGEVKQDVDENSFKGFSL